MIAVVALFDIGLQNAIAAGSDDAKSGASVIVVVVAVVARFARTNRAIAALRDFARIGTIIVVDLIFVVTGFRIRNETIATGAIGPLFIELTVAIVIEHHRAAHFRLRQDKPGARIIRRACCIALLRARHTRAVAYGLLDARITCAHSSGQTHTTRAFFIDVAVAMVVENGQTRFLCRRSLPQTSSHSFAFVA